VVGASGRDPAVRAPPQPQVADRVRGAEIERRNLIEGGGGGGGACWESSSRKKRTGRTFSLMREGSPLRK
jgi:hypothetical protein